MPSRLSAVCGVLLLAQSSLAGERSEPAGGDPPIWERVLEARVDLTVLDSMRMLENIPCVAADAPARRGSAALAAVVLGADKDEALCGMTNATFERIISIGFPRIKNTRDARRVCTDVWEQLARVYNTDRADAFRAFGKKTSSGKLYAELLRRLAEPPARAGKETAESLCAAVRTFAAHRDLDVTTACREYSWDICREAIIRDTPFIVAPTGDEWHLCIGFVDTGTSRLLALIDPTKCSLKSVRGEDMISTADRLLGGESAAIISALGQGAVMETDRFFRFEGGQPAWLTFTALRSGTCIFVYGWRRNEVAFAERVGALLDECMAREEKR